MEILGVKDFLLKLRSPTGQTMHQCEDCGYQSRYPTHVKDHILRAHASPTYDECPFCNKIFKTKPALRDHQRRCLGKKLVDDSYAGDG